MSPQKETQTTRVVSAWIHTRSSWADTKVMAAPISAIVVRVKRMVRLGVRWWFVRESGEEVRKQEEGRLGRRLSTTSKDTRHHLITVEEEVDRLVRCLRRWLHALSTWHDTTRPWVECRHLSSVHVVAELMNYEDVMYTTHETEAQASCLGA